MDKFTDFFKLEESERWKPETKSVKMVIDEKTYTGNLVEQEA